MGRSPFLCSNAEAVSLELSRSVVLTALGHFLSSEEDSDAAPGFGVAANPGQAKEREEV